MDKVSELSCILKKYFDWHKSRIDCFAQMLIALFTVRTVNLNELAIAMSSKAQIASRTKRLYRFFAHFEIDMTMVTRWILTLFFSESPQVYVAIDRTNWYWGKKPINILMLSICFEGIAIPFLWKILPNGGGTSAVERIDFCRRLMDVLDVNRIAGLLGDREFACKDFVRWLNFVNIPYYLRVKSDAQIYIGKKKFRKASQLFSDLKPYEHKVFGMRVEIFGCKSYIVASRNERGELMIVITNVNYKNAIPIYLRRWEVESLFQALKSRGFRFEETHMTDPQRIEKMIAVLAVAFSWAHKVGEWRAIRHPIALKKFKHQYRPQYSFFRYGLDFIRDAFTGVALLPKLAKYCLKILENPQMEAIL